jgi:hypothetical protein
MNSNDNPLQRLLDSAAKAPRPVAPVSAGPFGAETRFLAAWRPGSGRDQAALLVYWLRRAIALALALVLLSAAWNYRHTAEAGADEVSLADSAFQIASR